MLYDPKWNEPPKPDLFALTTLITWLETRPPSERYHYGSPGNCLLAQYFTEMTGRYVTVSYSSVYLDDEQHALPKGWDDIAYGRPFKPSSRTFGAAFKRAKRLWLKAAAGSIWSRIPQLLGLT